MGLALGIVLVVLGAALSGASVSFDDGRLLVASGVVGVLGILCVLGGG